MKTTKPEVRPRSGKKPIPIEKRTPPPLPKGDAPDWLTKTPVIEYSLRAWDDHSEGGSDVEHLILTLEEYEKLKTVLACLRLEGKVTGSIHLEKVLEAIEEYAGAAAVWYGALLNEDVA